MDKFVLDVCQLPFSTLYNGHYISRLDVKVTANSLFIVLNFVPCMFVTDERLNDIVGSAYYVAPEVLHRSYSVEADIWSIGVITYILLCGSRPFWARTESGIFRSVLRSDPNFDDLPWPSVSPEAKDFVKRLLNKDYRKRMTSVQALCKSGLCTKLVNT